MSTIRGGFPSRPALAESPGTALTFGRWLTDADKSSGVGRGPFDNSESLLGLSTVH